MSAVYRAPIFFLTSMKAGWRAALSAMLVESVFRAVTSGFYGAVVQAIRELQPAWLAASIILVALPLVVQALEYLVHWLRGTPNLGAGALVSVLVTATASLFNWYAMRRGTLLTGGEGQPFWADLKALPFVIGCFISAGPRAAWRAARRLHRLITSGSASAG